ncbi:MAG: uroporphyrinogen-III synthase [Alphaproteobacteria bacterium]|nr:MAG: uroporphyrinogen-III synthase [Alphaproteobacteria bacterium]
MGWAPVVQPLLQIRPLAPDVPDLDGFAAVAFTSRNGVAAFVALTSRRGFRVFAVGDATAQAARDAGFADVLSADGAVDDLAALIAQNLGYNDRLLAAVAKEPVADLAALLAGHVRVDTLAVYEAVETGAAAPEDVAAILIHSPRAAAALAALDIRAAGRPCVVAISAHAAAPLKALRIADLRIASHPSDAAMRLALGKPAPGV